MWVRQFAALLTSIQHWTSQTSVPEGHHLELWNYGLHHHLAALLAERAAAGEPVSQ